MSKKSSAKRMQIRAEDTKLHVATLMALAANFDKGLTWHDVPVSEKAIVNAMAYELTNLCSDLNLSEDQILELTDEMDNDPNSRELRELNNAMLQGINATFSNANNEA